MTPYILISMSSRSTHFFYSRLIIIVKQTAIINNRILGKAFYTSLLYHHKSQKNYEPWRTNLTGRTFKNVFIIFFKTNKSTVRTFFQYLTTLMFTQNPKRTKDENNEQSISSRAALLTANC